MGLYSSYFNGVHISRQKLRDLKKAVREVAAEWPNNVYQLSNPEITGNGIQCSYTAGENSDCPRNGCIVGQAFVRSGVLQEHEVAQLDNAGLEPVGIATILSKLTFNGNTPSHWKVIKRDERHELLYWLTSVQEAQDRGQTWQEAVYTADAALTEYSRARAARARWKWDSDQDNAVETAEEESERVGETYEGDVLRRAGATVLN